MKLKKGLFESFFSSLGACHNKECPFLHIDPETKIKDCPWYDRGFCRHGPTCRHRHVRRMIDFVFLQFLFQTSNGLHFRRTLHELHSRILPRRPRMQIRPVITKIEIY